METTLSWHGGNRLSWLEMHPSASRGARIPMMQATQDRHRAYRARAGMRQNSDGRLVGAAAAW